MIRIINYKNYRMNIKRLLSMSLLFYTVMVSAQNVTHITSTQVGSTIQIHYTLDQTATIQLYYSLDGGRSEIGPLKKVSGDVGEEVSAGNKIIYWDVLSEVDELHGNKIVFIVKAYDPWREQNLQTIKPKTSRNYISEDWFVAADLMYSFSPLYSYGFTIGHVRRFGWYLSGNTNFKYTGMPSSSSIPDGTYVFTGEESKTRISIM